MKFKIISSIVALVILVIVAAVVLGKRSTPVGEEGESQEQTMEEVVQ